MLRGLFSRRERPTLEHELFGRIEFSRTGVWENEAFAFWGFDNVYLLIDGGAGRPGTIQEEAFRRFLERRESLLPRILAAVQEKRVETELPVGPVDLRAMSLPAMDPGNASPSNNLWTIWFDYEGEENWSYGVQTTDRWETFTAFAEG